MHEVSDDEARYGEKRSVPGMAAASVLASVLPHQLQLISNDALKPAFTPTVQFVRLLPEKVAEPETYGAEKRTASRAAVL